MNLYFDTSALVKLFHEESGTEVVTDLINNPENSIFISDLTRLEFISALCRRYRNKEINDQELNEALSGFREDYSRFHVEPLGQMVLQEAEELLMKYGKTYGLRTLDALHLATAPDLPVIQVALLKVSILSFPADKHTLTLLQV